MISLDIILLMVAARLKPFRLGGDELAMLRWMVDQGFAKNENDAVRLALQMAPLGIAQRYFQNHERYVESIEELRTQLGRLTDQNREPIGRGQPSMIEMLPLSIEVTQSQEQRVVARVRNRRGNLLEGVPIIWSVLPRSLGSVRRSADGTGVVFRASRDVGIGRLIARIGDVSRATEIRVGSGRQD